MRAVLRTSVVLAMAIGPAAAQRLPDQAVDPGRLAVFHGTREWTLGCANAHMLMRIKEELDGRPIRVESHARMAQFHCSIMPSSEPLRLWHEYDYVGFSGVADGPKFAQIITKSMGGMVLFVMRDEIAPEKSYVTELHPD